MSVAIRRGRADRPPRKGRRVAVVLAAMAVGVLLPGCALMPETIVLGPAPPAAQPLAGANGVVVRVRVRDQRPRTDRVSVKVNSHGHELAPIQAAQDVALTVQKALEAELQARGFATAPGAADVTVSVGLQHLFSDFRVGFLSGDAVAQVQLAVSVQGAEGLTRCAQLVGADGTGARVQLFNGANAPKALNQALEATMRALFADPGFTAALLGRPAAQAASPPATPS